MHYGRNGPGTIRAIETKWHGCRFRSKLEAKWAVVFEAMGLEWEYEPVGFTIDGLWYAPDFIVAGLVGYGPGWAFVEVKGRMGDFDREKIRALSRHFPVYVVGDIPNYDVFEYQYRAFSRDTYFHSLSLLDVGRTKGVIEAGAIGIGHDGMPEILPEWRHDGDYDATDLAFKAGCYARFDHEERPEEQPEFRGALTRIRRLKIASAKAGTERKSIMPKLPWNTIQESTGTFSDIEPGGYTLVITKAEPHESQQYVRFYWDVADGASKGAYAQSQWPPSDIMSWKDSVQGILKHKLHVLADSNPGFQPTVAFDNDDWQAFVGKKFGAVVRKRLYTAGPNSKNPGADKETVEVAGWFTPEQIAAHDYSDALMRTRDQRDKSAAPAGGGYVGGGQVVTSVPDSYQPAQQDDLYDESIPF